LNAIEVVRLEKFEVRPDCRHHNHLRRTDAEQLIQSGQCRWVGLKRRALTAARFATDRGYDNSFGPKDDRDLVIARSGPFITCQLLHGGEKKK
jgi:hypothetical protein